MRSNFFEGSGSFSDVSALSVIRLNKRALENESVGEIVRSVTFAVIALELEYILPVSLF